jgi:hypothetical protein
MRDKLSSDPVDPCGNGYGHRARFPLNYWGAYDGFQGRPIPSSNPQAEIPYPHAGFQTIILKKIIFTIVLNAFATLAFFSRDE